MHEILTQAGAEMIAYDRWEIVSTFGEPQAEYAAIRKAAGLIDRPFRGILEFTGRDRHAFLNNLLTNQTYDKSAKQAPPAGRWTYTFLLNLGGRVVADLNILEQGDHTLLEIDARLAPMLAKFFDDYIFGEQMKITSPRESLRTFALHGPLASEVIQAEMGTILAVGECRTVSFLDKKIVLFRDDVCGEIGINMIVPAEIAPAVWQHFLSKHGGGGGARQGGDPKRTLRPIGWAAFNACRVEAGRPLFGIDFELAEPTPRGPAKVAEAGTKANAEPGVPAKPRGVLPAETGLLDRAVSFTKGCYLGQEIVARMHARGQVARKLVGLRIHDGALPIAGQPVMDVEHQPIGIVTSSTMSPLLGDAAIALAIVKKPYFDTGKEVFVPAEGAIRSTVIVELPFVSKSDLSPCGRG